MRTYTPKQGEITRAWHIIDATDVVLGRLASQTAILLRGKHKPTFAPHVDGGDFVIIINAEKVALTGAKLAQKKAYHHSGHPGGLKSTSSPRRITAPLPWCFSICPMPCARALSRSCVIAMLHRLPVRESAVHRRPARSA